MKSVFRKFGLCLGLSVVALGAAALEAPVWKVGVADHVYPFSYVDQVSGQQKGFDVDMAKAICDEMKHRCEIVPMRYIDLHDALERQDLQMVVNGWRHISQHQSHFAFSDPYYRSQIIFVSADANSPKITPQTVGKRTIGALVNSGQALLVRQHYLTQGATLREYPSSTTLYNAVQNGEVDVVCVSGFAGYEYLKQSENKNLHIVGLHRNLEPEMAGRRVVIHQDNADRIEAINRALLNIKSDGRYQAINLRYFEFMIY